MVKPEWGKKRTCQNCAVNFYDLQRNPIVCPKCETVFEPPAPAKPRRPRPAPAPKVAVVEPVAEETAATPTDDGDIAAIKDVAVDDTKTDAATDDEEKKDDVIEDVTELGEDEDDMAEVLESAVVKDDAGSA